MRAEEALRESQERFRYLIETIKDWIWEVDAQGVYPSLSPMELIAGRLHSEKQERLFCSKFWFTPLPDFGVL